MDKKTKIQYIVGIDEVGRGPLAGPVTVCALKIAKKDLKKVNKIIFGQKPLKDSKKLKELEREDIYKQVKVLKKEGLLDFVVSSVSNLNIDKNGISASIKKALNNSLIKIASVNNEIRLDGSLKASNEYIKQKTIIKGDEKELVIALASIVAKVTRDRYMKKMGKKFPKYGFEVHKGYGTKKHIGAIKDSGLSSLHRESFCRNIKVAKKQK